MSALEQGPFSAAMYQMPTTWYERWVDGARVGKTNLQDFGLKVGAGLGLTVGSGYALSQAIPEDKPHYRWIAGAVGAGINFAATIVDQNVLVGRVASNNKAVDAGILNTELRARDWREQRKSRILEAAVFVIFPEFTLPATGGKIINTMSNARRSARNELAIAINDDWQKDENLPKDA